MKTGARQPSWNSVSSRHLRRWIGSNFSVWLADGLAGKKMAEGTYRGKTITSFTLVDCDRLIKGLLTVSGEPTRLVTEYI